MKEKRLVIKRWICMVCVVFCLFSLVGCQAKTEGTALLPAGEISSVRVFSQPDYYDCFYYGVHAKPVVEYLERLTLQSNFDENPDEHDGMTIKIIVVYEDGQEFTIYHFGNKFIRTENSDWYKMDYAEAVQLEEILAEKQSQ